MTVTGFEAVIVEGVTLMEIEMVAVRVGQLDDSHY